MKSTKYHLRLDVRGAIRNKSFSGFQHDDGRKMSRDEAFEALCDLLAQGKNFIPIGDCDNFDPEHGCKGHPSEMTLRAEATSDQQSNFLSMQPRKRE